MSSSFDVVIIGAGPAGAATAIALARTGYQVALLDKRIFPRDKLCGDFVNPINWPALKNLGVAELLLAQPHAEVTGFRITTASGAEAETAFDLPAHERAPGLGIRRAVFDQVLVERAGALGVQMRLGRRVRNLTRTHQGWRLQIGSEEILQARLLVGADGRNSWVAQQLGMSGHDASHGRSVGFQTRLRCPGPTAGKIEIHLFPGGYAGLVSLGDGTATLGLAIEKSRLPDTRPGDFLFNECLPRNPHLRAALQRGERIAELRSAYPVYFPARRCYADGALLVGDAARVSEPITGEGVHCAIESGLLAADTLGAALRAGNGSADCLRSYERACNRAFRKRFMLNSLLRCVIYRPAWLEPLIRLSEKNNRILTSLVDRVCLPQAAR